MRHDLFNRDMLLSYALQPMAEFSWRFICGFSWPLCQLFRMLKQFKFSHLVLETNGLLECRSRLPEFSELMRYAGWKTVHILVYGTQIHNFWDTALAQLNMYLWRQSGQVAQREHLISHAFTDSGLLVGHLTAVRVSSSPCSTFQPFSHWI